MEVQTRDEDGALEFFDTITEAFEHAKRNPSIWKVSFTTEDDEYIRFIRYFPGNNWQFKPLMEEVYE